jgi:hypothetical protein
VQSNDPARDHPARKVQRLPTPHQMEDVLWWVPKPFNNGSACENANQSNVNSMPELCFVQHFLNHHTSPSTTCNSSVAASHSQEPNISKCPSSDTSIRSIGAVLDSISDPIRGRPHELRDQPNSWTANQHVHFMSFPARGRKRQSGTARRIQQHHACGPK